MATRVAQKIEDTFEISHRMEKRLDLETNDLAKANLHIGKSRREACNAFKAENGGKISTHEKGQNTGFHSWGSFHKYRDCFKTFAHYCAAVYEVKHISDIKPHMSVAFCEKLHDLGYSKNSVNGFVSSIEKFGAFLKIDFHGALKEYKHTKAYKTLEVKDVNTRAYEMPQIIIDKLKDLKCQIGIAEKTTLSAQLALNYGLRINDACHFKVLDGNRIAFNSKNGMKTTRTISPEDHAKAASLAENGRFNLSVNTMKGCWSRACKAAGFENTGFHGLRHCYAQDTYTALIGRGLNHAEASSIVSHELNHSRPSITEVYLR